MHKYGLISTREGYNLFYKQYWGKILTYFSLTDQLEGILERIHEPTGKGREER